MGKRSFLIPLLTTICLVLQAAIHRPEAPGGSGREPEPWRDRGSNRVSSYHHGADPVNEVEITLATAAGEITIFVSATLAKVLVQRECCWYTHG